MPYAEILFVSAKTGQRLNKLFDTIDMVSENLGDDQAFLTQQLIDEGGLSHIGLPHNGDPGPVILFFDLFPFRKQCKTTAGNMCL